MFGWVVSTGLFILIIAILGGPSTVDSRESVFSTWFIQHGQLACAFPLKTPSLKPVIAPVYLIYSGLIASVAHIGSAVPFPHEHVVNSRCTVNYIALDRWSQEAGALNRTIEIGYSAWVFLLAGIVAWLRSTGRGRRGWEPATLIVVACLAPVITCVENFFHPQDLVALGLSLTALALGQRGRWFGAGIIIGLAVLTQQYALLVAAPLLVLAPSNRRLAYLGGAGTGACLVVIPILIATSGTALRALAIGSGDALNPSAGGSVVFSFGLNDTAYVVVTDIVPVVLALLLALWMVRRPGTSAQVPTAMIALVATCLALRLVFAPAIFSYYFMALAVTVLLIDVARKQVRGSAIAWLASITVVYAVDGYSVFSWVSWTHDALVFVPMIVIFIALVIVIVGLVMHWTRWNIFLALVTVGFTLGTWRQFESPLLDHLPPWAWQLIFVSWGLALAAAPLLGEVRKGSSSRSLMQMRRSAGAIAP